MSLKRFVLLAIAMFLISPVFAADHSAANLADTWKVIIKEGHHEEFKKAFNDHLKQRARKKDSRTWKTYAPMLGNEFGYYIVRACCVSYAEMDEYAAWAKKTKIDEHWNDNVDPHVAGYEHYFAKVDLANSNWPEDDSKYKMFGVTIWKEKSNRDAQIAASKATLSKAAMDGGWSRHWSWASRIGGKGGLMLVSPYLNFVDMEGPEGGFAGWLAGKVGEQRAGEMLSNFSENFHGSTFTVYRLVDDMSMSKK